MTSYMVLFNPLTHGESYVPPEPILGGVTGTTDQGMLGVYEVPEGMEQEFEAHVSKCPSFMRLERL